MPVRAVAVDMFPHTVHCEMLVHLIHYRASIFYGLWITGTASFFVGGAPHVYDFVAACVTSLPRRSPRCMIARRLKDYRPNHPGHNSMSCSHSIGTEARHMLTKISLRRRLGRLQIQHLRLGRQSPSPPPSPPHVVDGEEAEHPEFPAAAAAYSKTAAAFDGVLATTGQFLSLLLAAFTLNVLFTLIINIFYYGFTLSYTMEHYFDSFVWDLFGICAQGYNFSECISFP